MSIKPILMKAGNRVLVEGTYVVDGPNDRVFVDFPDARVMQKVYKDHPELSVSLDKVHRAPEGEFFVMSKEAIVAIAQDLVILCRHKAEEDPESLRDFDPTFFVERLLHCCYHKLHELS